MQEIEEHRKVPELMARIQKIVPTIQGWCPIEKALIMATWIVQRKPALIVELGVFGGRSLIPMAMACQVNGIGKAVGIDPWSIEAALEGENAKENDEWWGKTINLEDVFKTFVHRVLEFDLTRTCEWQRMKSDDAVKLYRDSSIDFLHIDGNHSQKTSCNDVDLWHGKVRSGGLVIMDDIDWDTTKLAQELLTQKGFVMTKSYHKWGIFQKS